MQIGDLVLHLKEIFPGLKERSATDIIKFALQKQIPMESKWGVDGWVCPKCGCKRKERFSHCVACGQALKRTENWVTINRSICSCDISRNRRRVVSAAGKEDL